MIPERGRLAILLGSPLTEDVFDLIGMPYLAETFDVTILDCVNWVRTGRAVDFRRYAYDPVVTVANAGEFDRVLARTRPAYALDFISKGPLTRAIQDALRRVGAKYVAQRIAPSPLPAARASGAGAAAFLGRAARWALRAAGNANPRPPDIAVLAGLSAKDYWTGAARTILWTGSPDYFRLRDLQRATDAAVATGPTPTGPYALFIDDCLALSLDYAVTGRPRPIEPDLYFSMLRGTLDRLEAAISMPVVIAAHPNGKDIPGYALRFGPRAVHFDMTAALSVGCEVALTHYSTAVSYPVLLRKPLVLLGARALEGTYPGEAVKTLAGLLRRPVMPMDDSRAAVAVAPVDEEAYAGYEKQYVTTERREDRHPFQPFVRFAAERQPV